MSLKLNNKLTDDILQRLRDSLSPLDQAPYIHEDALSNDMAIYVDTYGFFRMKQMADYRLGCAEVDGRRIALHQWQPKGASAQAFVVHGLFDHTGLFLDVVDYLLGLGLDVLAIDLPGHGLSDGKPGVIHSFDEYGRAIKAALESIECDKPIFGVGQSTGCASLCNYILEQKGDAFSELVFFAPLLYVWRHSYVRISYRLFHRFMKKVPRSFSVNSHRKKFNGFLISGDPLQPHSVSVAWVGAMLKWVERWPALNTTDIPVTIIQGDSDFTVAWQKNLPAFEEKFSHCSVVMVPGAMHHLAQEGDHWRDQVFTAMSNALSSKQENDDTAIAHCVD